MAYAEIIPNTSVIEVQTVWNEKELIRQIPGAKWKANARAWHVPLGWAQCIMLRAVFEQIEFGPELTQWGWHELFTRVQPAMKLRMLYTGSEDLDGIDVYDSRLYDFQRIGAHFLTVAGDSILADEMGSGKTVQALTALQAIDGLPALIVCPNSTKLNWAREVREWYPDAEPIVIQGTATNRSKLFQQAEKMIEELGNAIVIINFESLRSYSRLSPYGSIKLASCRVCDPSRGQERIAESRCETHQKILNKLPFRTVIVDEAHKMKDPQSKQTRACWAVMHGPTVTCRWALTGTPLANHPGDLWSILHGITPHEHPTRSKFIDRFCLSAWNPYGGLDIVGLNPERKSEFYSFVDPRFRRMPKALVLSQLPPKVRIRRYVEMTPKQSAAYRDISQKYITRLDTGALLVASNDILAQTRLLQLSSSYCKVFPDPEQPSGFRVEMCEPSPKLDALLEIMEELEDRQLVACAESKQLINMAAARMEKLKIPYGIITGDQSQWERDDYLRRFQAGELRILLFTVKAGGTGLTMTAADTIVFLQRSMSMVDNKQAEDRVHRIGSERHESINVIDIITRDTVEERQINNLHNKLLRLEEITRDRLILIQNNASTEDLDVQESAIINSHLELT